MAKILVFQHDQTQGTGRLGATLRDHGFQLDIRQVTPTDPRDSIPTDLDGIHGIISLGGSHSTLDNTPSLDAERALLKAAHEKSMPVVGICFGHQLLAQALGGTVSKAETPELGFKAVTIPAGPPQTETINTGIAWSSPRFQHHFDEVSEAPPGAMVLWNSEACKIQAYRVGHRSFGFQSFPEFDRSQIERMFSLHTAAFEAAGITEAELKNQLNENYEMFARLADRLCLNLAAYAFPFSQLTAV